MGIFVTIHAGREFHFVNCILAGGNMAFRALHGNVFAL